MSDTLARRIYSLLGGLLIVAAAFLTYTWNSKTVFFEDGVYFADGDCYARMTRVQMVLEHPFTPLRHHDFENYPEGTTPHTTAPLDFLIAGLSLVLKPFSAQPLDLAGAYISPLLGILLVGYLWWWSGKVFPGGLRWPLLVTVVLSPILVHGFQLGRPDHQSLIILLVGIAWAAELALWRNTPGRWHLVSAISWGLALWVSLFEPAILLVATLLLRALVGFVSRRHALLPDRTSLIVFFSILALWLLFDGWRGTGLPDAYKATFWRWAQSIGELQHTSVSQIFAWCGWLLAVAPALLVLRSLQLRTLKGVAWAVMLLLLTGLTLWHMRWGYFLALSFAFALPIALAAIPWKPVAWAAFIIALWPVASEWDEKLFPDQEELRARNENLADAVLLRSTIPAMTNPGSILAPWWLTPAAVYWSRHPGMGGSSHQSLPGIVDTAEFYTTTDQEKARKILEDHHVRYVIAYEPSRILENSAQVLGTPQPASSFATELFRPRPVPPRFLRLVNQNRFFRIYEVTPD